ncbi:MAG: hypothetical protein DU480_10920 [Nitrosomonas sp.]|uniref:hypothetical protein n=1 Tax=Nitrosomonas sp. TaxID=42353 RepID=UPI0032ED6DD6
MMKNNWILGILIVSLPIANLVSAAETNSDEFEKQRAPHIQEKEKNITSEPKEEHRGIISPTYQLFDMQFSSWNANHLHWDAPTNMAIQSDGSWFIYAKKLANMRRTGGAFDTGDRWTTLINVTFYTGPLNGQKQCTGSVIHSRDYELMTLDYKEESYNVTARGSDSEIARAASNIKCGSFSRIWR